MTFADQLSDYSMERTQMSNTERMSLVTSRILLLAMFTLPLVACGGGSGDGNTGDNTGEPDPVSVVVSENILLLDETGTGELMVSLSGDPGEAVNVAVASDNTEAATFSPSMLSFDSSNYDDPQAITVTGIADPDRVDEAMRLTLSANGLLSAVAAVFISDSDTIAVLTSQRSLSLVEGANQTVDVMLSGDPGGSLTVALASSDPGAVDVSPATLTFDSSNYSTVQTVTLTAVNDQDPSDEFAEVSFTAPGIVDGIIGVAVRDPLNSVVVSSSILLLDESGTGSLLVTLSDDPNGTVDVTVASDNGEPATFTPSALTFDSSNYDTPQAITVTGIADADRIDESMRLTFTAENLASAIAAVFISDSDAIAVVTSERAVSVVEGSDQTVDVVLSGDPGASVTVTLASSDPGAVAVTPATLTFDSSNYSTAQSVTLSALDDNDPSDELAEISLAGAGTVGTTVGVSVRDLLLQDIVIDRTSFALTENDSEIINVSLEYDPAGTVEVRLGVYVSQIYDQALSVSPSTLTFDSSNYSVPQSVTITSTGDPDARDSDGYIQLTADDTPPSYVQANINDVTVPPYPVELHVRGKLPGEPGNGSVYCEYEGNDTYVAHVPHRPGRLLVQDRRLHVCSVDHVLGERDPAEPHQPRPTDDADQVTGTRRQHQHPSHGYAAGNLCILPEYDRPGLPGAHRIPPRGAAVARRYVRSRQLQRLRSRRAHELLGVPIAQRDLLSVLRRVHSHSRRHEAPLRDSQRRQLGVVCEPRRWDRM